MVSHGSELRNRRCWRENARDQVRPCPWSLPVLTEVKELILLVGTSSVGPAVIWTPPGDAILLVGMGIDVVGAAIDTAAAKGSC